MHFTTILIPAFTLLTAVQGASVPAWHPPAPTDVRSPCPALNALANHGILPRSGKDITPKQYIDAMSQIGVAVDLGASLAYASPFLVPSRKNAQGETVFGLDDLRKHGGIEHDASLTRNDFNTSPNHDNFSFNQTLYDQLISLKNPTTGRLDTDSLAKARFLRQSESKATNPAPVFDVKQDLLAHGEAALLLTVFGNQFDSQVPVNVAESILAKEKLPFEEGWVPAKLPVGILKVTAVSQVIKSKEGALAKGGQ
ncbi:uncharacterized protein SPPG_05833 [Spizellomyces punctatus DAOM BR117]|uniref:Heme haloperoxidase family profile domain-containing protein n=1 Tax=Spizellomyces punctatus (strain DAOM BR117) TaxID=645134 RepID=A0A0L0HBA3_SPIPD|nr:uncharacterized protein SPPG_05833 [Spizellomyces punctatus DAOM BR117]KNC98865.1 hypothetical protein SPPG_05833 [Spizellomyces punctatus DAOM BR117]|eukprot:XP_016606905.1 hypothetical protein SPPG_05833 [Spizellomyces punctatus DAOM BR117]